MHSPFLLQRADTGLGWLYSYACWQDAAESYVTLATLTEAGGLFEGLAGLLTDGGDDED